MFIFACFTRIVYKVLKPYMISKAKWCMFFRYIRDKIPSNHWSDAGFLDIRDKNLSNYWNDACFSDTRDSIKSAKKHNTPSLLMHPANALCTNKQTWRQHDFNMIYLSQLFIWCSLQQQEDGTSQNNCFLINMIFWSETLSFYNVLTNCTGTVPIGHSSFLRLWSPLIVKWPRVALSAPGWSQTTISMSCPQAYFRSFIVLGAYGSKGWR